MAGFIRRVQSFPSQEFIEQIEGVIIVDLPPPGSVKGVGTGCVAVVGEFADLTYATRVSTAGVVSSDMRPVELVSAQDMLEKLGGWDETIGEFGGDGGNGFVTIRNKKFSRLVAVPINFAASRAVRVWRDLPTNKLITDPSPIVPLSSGVVAAGREFKDGANRARLGKRVVFTDTPALGSGVDGDVTNAPAAVTLAFSAAGATFVAWGVAEGDILVVGVIGDGGANGTNAGTYRIVSVGGETSLTIEKMDGTAFNMATSAVLAWRVHPGETADSGPDNQLSEAAGYTCPARPLDADITAGTVCSPTVVPAAGSASAWDSLSGLKMRTLPGATNFVYTAALHAPNAVTSASWEALYKTAVDSLLSEEEPARSVNLVVFSRTSTVQASNLRAHLLEASQQGLGRMGAIAPALDGLLTTTNAIKSTWPGVGLYRNERLLYGWPGVQTFIPEAVGYDIKGADGSTYDDGILDTPWCDWIISVLSNLAPERNPGQAADPIPTVLAPVLGFQRGLTSPFSMNDYKLFRQYGICAPRFDRVAGCVIQSGITTSLTSGEKNIARRRMADFIEDSLAGRLVQFSKLPLTQQLKDTIESETAAFLRGLLSPNNPAAQRISAYEVDALSGNTPDLEAAGIFVVIVRVRTLASADFIVLQAEIGESVQVSQAA